MYKYNTMSKKIIPPRGDLYFHNGCFYVKNKWAKKIRTGLITVLFTIGSFVSANAMFSDHSKVMELPTIYSSKHSALVDYATRVNSNLTTKDASNIISKLEQWSDKFDVELSLLVAIMKVESAFDAHAISNAGALGLMQVIPYWHLNKIKKAKEIVGTPEIFDIETNTFIGTWVLKGCMETHSSTKKALLCYNGSLNSPNGYDEKVISTKNEIERFIKQNT